MIISAIPFTTLSLPGLRREKRLPLGTLTKVLLLVAGYELAAWLSYTTADLSVEITGLWLPAGVAVAAMLRYGYRLLPLLLACNILADLTMGGFAWPAALGIGVISAIADAAVVWLLRRGERRGFAFDVPSIARFAIGGLMLAPVLSGLAAVGWLILVGDIRSAQFIEVARNWSVGGGLGILLVVPLAESWRLYGRPRFKGELSEAISILLVLAILCGGVFAYELGHNDLMLPVCYAMLFLMIWFAIYFRESGASTCFAVSFFVIYLFNSTVAYDPLPAWVIGVYGVPFALIGMILATTQTKLEQKVARQAKQQELERLAYKDALTGLANRTTLEQWLEQAVEQAKEQGRKVAVIFIDLDRFKQINDTYGHETGDAVLKAIARRLEGAVRDTDLVARLGGDEFVVVLSEVDTEVPIQQLIERLRHVFEGTVSVGEHAFEMQASLGVAIYPEHGDQPSELVRRSDQAMYRVKRDPESAWGLCDIERRRAAGSAECATGDP
jgi:diguanylate cyclase (GGDEF)-like protein